MSRRRSSRSLCSFSRTLPLFLIVVLALLSVAPTVWANDPPPASPAAQERGFSSELNAQLDAVFGKINGVLLDVLFLNVTGDLFQVEELGKDGQPVVESGRVKMRTVRVPLVVALLGIGGIVFTLSFGFINLRAFRHAIEIVRGKYDDENDEGEVSHFRALTSALSATVGLGNIAGVAIAIQLGGPGAVFWMIAAAVFGMSSKFSSCTLAQLYRQRNSDGSVSGGAMYYLDLGLKSRNMATLGKFLGVTYAIMIMGGSMGAGNMFQANQAFEAVSSSFGVSTRYSIVFGLIMATLVGLVVLGGIQRIGAATSRIVPLMVAIYVAASTVVLVVNFHQIPHALALIFDRAFSASAAYGGVVGVIVSGVQRASFSNEAGLGSSAIAHAAAKTDEPIREGLVAMLEPFIDTIVVCTMTALVVIVSGAWNDPNIPQEAGVALTTSAFATVIPWFPKVLGISVLLFAYSTMISWCYYGERGWIYLLDHFGVGLKTLPIFRLIFVCFVFIGSVTSLGAVLTFSDILVLCIAMPNILGSFLLIPVIRQRLKDYLARMEQEALATQEAS